MKDAVPITGEDSSTEAVLPPENVIVETQSESIATEKLQGTRELSLKELGEINNEILNVA